MLVTGSGDHYRRTYTTNRGFTKNASKVSIPEKYSVSSTKSYLTAFLRNHTEQQLQGISVLSEFLSTDVVSRCRSHFSSAYVKVGV